MKIISHVIFVTVLAIYRFQARVQMWFNTEAVQQALSKTTAARGTADADAIKQAELRREAEKKILEEGTAVCMHCGDDIYHNPEMISGGWTWESEDMVGWCNESSQHKHTPKIVIPNG